MKHILLSLFSLLIGIGCYAQQPSPETYNNKMQQQNLLFMENMGQVVNAKGTPQTDVLFTAKSNGAQLWLTATGISYQFNKTDYPAGYNLHDKTANLAKLQELQAQAKHSSHRFTVQLVGSNPHPKVVKQKQSEYFENYYLAHCPQGITGVKAFEQVTYKNVYPNIDWVIYSKGGYMEYDFIVHPGGNPAQIKLKINDADKVTLTDKGELVVKTRLGEVREKTPISYNEAGRPIATRFVMHNDGSLGFAGAFPKNKTLRIDPEVVWATYYGGGDLEYANGCSADTEGNAYLIGETSSTSGIASGGFQNTYGGSTIDAFLVKFSASGARLWATYYGGASYDSGQSCKVENNGAIYFSGYTNSNTAIASGGAQNTLAGSYDAFLVKFTASGTRTWGTYFGATGRDHGYTCILDGSGNIYLSGYTESATGIASNGFQSSHGGGTQDAFLAKFSSSGSRLWSTYYGGTGIDYAEDIATDSDGNIYMAGHTTSASGIASLGFQNSHGGGTRDAYLVKFNASGSRLWATYYGGSANDRGYACATDSNGNVYLSGATGSSGLASGGHQNTTGPDYKNDAFLVKFNAGGTRQWATYYGEPNEDDAASSCMVDGLDNVYIAGVTGSYTGIASGGFLNTRPGGLDMYIAKFNANGSRLWGSYCGTSGYDSFKDAAINTTGNVYIAGDADSDTGLASGGFQNTYGGGFMDAFLIKIYDETSCVTPAPNAIGQDVAWGTTVAGLSATGTALQWYTTPTGGTALPATTVVTTATYYVSQILNGCESPRTPVLVTVDVPSCAPPLDVTVTITSATRANFSWNRPVTNLPTNYQYHVSTSATPPASGTTLSVTTINNFAITANTTYYLHVRSNCSGDYSDWVTSAPFRGVSTGYTCATAINLADLVSPFSGTTVGSVHDYSIACTGGNTAPDMFFYIDVPNGSTVTIGQTANNYDSENYMGYGNACPGATQIACFDDSDIQNRSWTNNTGSTQRVYWVQDGHGGSTSAGTFTLAWTLTAPTTACNAPTALTATATSIRTANLSWTAPATTTPTGYQYAVTTSATPPASGTNTTATSLTGYVFLPSTYYYLHVRTNCSGTYSAWATSAQFSGIPPQGDTCATAINLATLTSPYSSTLTGALNNTYPIDCTLDGPDLVYYIDVMQAQTLVIGLTARGGFDAHNYIGYGNTCPGTTLISCHDDPDIHTTTWTNNTGSTQRVYWLQEASSGTSAGDFTLAWSVTGGCAPPTNPRTLAISYTSANLYWTAPEVSTPTGYEYAVTMSSTPPASGTATTATSVTPYYGLQAFEDYYLHVRTNCNGSYSSWVTSPVFTGSTYGDLCSNAIDLSTLTSPHSNTTANTTSGSTVVCDDFIVRSRDLYYYMVVPNGATFTIGQTSNDYDSFVSVKYTSDAMFCPGSYSIACFDNPNVQTVTWTNTTGSTQIVYWVQGGRLSEEVGNFTLAWTLTGGTATCNPPATATTTATSSTAVNLNWTAPTTGTPTGYQYAVTTSATPPASGTATTARSVTGYTINAGTTYYLHVRSNCSGTYSSWTTSAPFSGTAATCNPPTAPYGYSVSPIRANLRWTAPASGTPIGYQYAVSTSATPPASGTATTGTTATNAVISAGNIYYLHVRSNCNGTYSSWVTSPPFTGNEANDVEGNECATAINLATLTSPYTSTTAAAAHDYSIACAGHNASPDRFYYINVPAGQTLTIGQTSNNYNSENYVGYGDDCPGINQIACLQDDLTPVTWTNNTGSTQTVYWVQDGAWAIDDAGTFTLAWTLTGGTACPAPASPFGQVTSATTANLGWAVPITGNPTGYQYAVTTSPTPPASGTATTNIDILDYAITANTDYYLHVRSNCNGTYSSWATSEVFRSTSSTCNPPTNLTAAVTSATTVNLSWTASTSSAPVGYQYAVTTSATPPASGTVFPNTSVTGYNIIAGTTYYLHVRTYCNGSYSNWATSAPFVGTNVINGDTCANAINLGALTSPYIGTTTGAGNDYTFTCAATTTAPELFFYIDVPNGYRLTIGQTYNNYDSQNYIAYGGSCPGTTRIDCFDDDDYRLIDWTNNTRSTQRVYWVQDGYQGGSGAFTLAWTLCDTPAPTAVTQTVCYNATVADLTATGTSLKWYTTSTGGTALTATTAVTTRTYYVSQTLNGCEGPRAAVAVTVNSIIPSPTASAQTLITGSTVANLTATGTALQWYTASTGGTALATGTVLNSGTYYVSQTLNGCESTRIAVTVTIYTPIAGDTCANAINLATLTSPYSSTTAGATNDYTITCSNTNNAADLFFYLDVPNGSTLTIGQTVNNYDSMNYMAYGGACPGTTVIACFDDDDYIQTTWTNSTGSTQRVYWVQDGFSTLSGTFTLAWTLTTPNTGCTNAPYGQVSSVAFTPSCLGSEWMNSARLGQYNLLNFTANTSYTLSSTVATDHFTVTDDNGATILAHGSNPFTFTPTTTGVYRYYIHSNAACGITDSNYRDIYIDCNTSTCTAPTNVIVSAVPNGANILWARPSVSMSNYQVYISTSPVAPSDSVAAVAATGVTFYDMASYNVSGLDSNTTYYCWVRTLCLYSNSSWVSGGSFTTIPQLECNNASYGLYPSATYTPACTGSDERITPSSWAGEFSNVNITANRQYSFSSSITTDYITITNAAGNAVLASGPSGVSWNSGSYSGVIRYYIHTNSTCGEQTGVVRSRYISCSACTTVAPTALAQTLCNGATIANLVANGTSLKWYSVATGGTQLATTAALVTGTYYVSQTLNSCESTRTAVSVTINSTSIPTAPDQLLCNGATVASLTATGTNLKWYSTYTGGTQLAANTVLSTGTYYVSQTINGCESARNTISVTINTTAAPTASAQTFCNSATVASLTANGTSLKWYSVATGGTQLATTATLATGTYYVSQTLNSCESTRTAVAVTINTTAVPTASAQTFCNGATVASLVANGTSLKWYSAATGGTQLATTTTLATGTYYVSQTLNSCESTRTAVSITINTTNAPTASAQTFCSGATVASLTANGTSLKWYTTATGGTQLATTATLATGTYYVSQTLNSCESTRTAVSITINTTNAPTASAQTFCNGATVASLLANGTSLKWYSAATSGTQLATTATLATGTYYVSQTLNSCESTRTAVAVTINTTATPTASAQTFCNGATVANLAANGTAVKWYSVATGGTQLATTATLATGTYYVSQTLNSCESTRTAVAVTINTTTAPTASAQTFCNGATVASLVANGTAVKWYSVATGGTQLATTATLATGTYYVSQTLNSCESTRTTVAVTINNTTAPTAAAQTFCNSATVASLVANGTLLKWYSVATGGTQLVTTATLATGTYYVSQTLNSCESTRTAVAVTINTTTAPTASAQTLSEGSTVANLTATGSNLQWYASPIGGTPLAPTTTLTTGTYYVSQTLNSCESTRTAVSVTINTPTTPAPTASAQTLCNGSKVADLVAVGTNLKWYTTATGGTQLASTIILTTATYYVSQTVNNIESPRTSVAVTINTTPTASAANQTFCGTATVADLVGVGTNLKWYSLEGDEGALAPTTPLTTDTYFVTQTINGCESASVPFLVTVNRTLVPTASAQTFCN
ncbi:hypothetical protein GR160_11935, partial [Flavobacterium sp. Sd200]|uniref:Ig-like domain-containing protein n=1 Tax=Flavobacterium sp. Sd200 TaxID=2692211 RepID=UPI001368141F